MLLTPGFILAHGLDALCARFKIKAVRGKRYSNLVLLKYNQIESPMAEPIVQECRGLVLDEADGFKPVCRAFDKFFNYGEPNAASIDWLSAIVYEKLDGSLCTIYHYRDEWHVATTGTPDAAGHVSGDTSITFADLFWKTFRDCGFHLPSPEWAGHCFMFELMTPLNRIVVQHAKPRLALIGVRDLNAGELSPESFAGRPELGWDCVRSFPLGCLDDCLAAAGALSPLEAEGYVVRDAHFRRIKVKSPRYVALAHLKEGMNGRRMLEIVRSNESAELLTYFPELASAYGRVRAVFDALCEEIDRDYARLRDIPDQRAFAAEAMKTRCSGALFAMRKGERANPREYFANATFPAVERAVGIDLASLVGDGSDVPDAEA